MSKELAKHIADYVNEKYRKKYHNNRTGPFPSITEELNAKIMQLSNMILEAIEAYEGDQDE